MPREAPVGEFTGAACMPDTGPVPGPVGPDGEPVLAQMGASL